MSYSIITLDSKLNITFFEGMKTEFIPETPVRVKEVVGMNYWDVFPWGHTLGMAEKMNAILSGAEVSYSVWRVLRRADTSDLVCDQF